MATDTNAATLFKLTPPTYSEAELAGEPWFTTELRIYHVLSNIQSQNSSPTASAQDLNLLFLSSQSDDGDANPEGLLWMFWELIARIASQVPHNHPAQDMLVEILKTLRGLSNPLTIKVSPEWGSDSAKLWEDTPFMGPAFREALDVDNGMKLEAFVARLSEAGLLAFWWLGLSRLREALEKEPPQPSGHDQEAGSTPGPVGSTGSDVDTGCGERFIREVLV